MSLLREGARAFGLELSDAQWATFGRYQDLLLEWNARFNLTSITAPREIEVKHFLDSLSVAEAFDSAARAAPQAVVDIGSGAGFPGIPLAIAFPAWQVLLLEATGKKVGFIEHVIRELPLPNARALQGRAEEVARRPQHRAQYSIALARAVAALPTLVEYALPLLRAGGTLVAQKGVGVEPEVESARAAISRLGGCLTHVVPVELPGLEPRHLIVIEKCAVTPAQYPRGAGLPKRKPIQR